MSSPSTLNLNTDHIDTELAWGSSIGDTCLSSDQAKRGTELSHDVDSVEVPADGGEVAEDACSICLHHMEDRTVVPLCSHEFCFECLLMWTGQSRRCPLCNQAVGEYLIHSIRSRYDYRKHFLPPLNGSSPTGQREHRDVLHNARQRAARRRRERRQNEQQNALNEADRLERSISHRRWVYKHDLYAKHVGSNPITKYRPYPKPSQFAASPDLISRTTTFLRRELRVWEGLDVEFLTNLIISLMKSIDIRSESAVKLLSEFLDMDAPYVVGGKHVNAEHFAHEVYCYVRSPYKDLFVYDTIVQYNSPPGLQPPSEIARTRRWNQRGDSRSPSPAADPEDSSSRGETGSRRRPAADHHNESPPRSRRRLAMKDAHNIVTERVASTSRSTLDTSSSITPLRSTPQGDTLPASATLFASSSSNQPRPTTPIASPLTGPSTQNFSPATSYPIQSLNENSESHVNRSTQKPRDPKGKGRVTHHDISLAPQKSKPSLLERLSDSRDLGAHGNAGLLSANSEDATLDARPIRLERPQVAAESSTESNRPPIRRDLKTSIRSYLS